uniref:Uncharacterized protein n=1 Tax=Oryza meridionalis TaxID=40149 RepID=A0A0E0E0F8_9ORYZ
MAVPLKMGKRRHRWGWRGNGSEDGEEEAVAGVEEDEGMGWERIRRRGSKDVETAVQCRPGWKGGVAPARRGGVVAQHHRERQNAIFSPAGTWKDFLEKRSFVKDHEKVPSVEGSDGLHHPESKSNDPYLLDNVQYYPRPKIIIILAYIKV